MHPLLFLAREGGYFFTSSWNFPFPEFSEGELLSLFILVNVLKQFENTPLEESLQVLRKKLEKIFPSLLGIIPDNLRMMLSPFVSVLEPRVSISENFRKVFGAIRNYRKIRITYRSLSSGERRVRDVEPYHLYNFEGVWYLCGFCLERQALRDFALDRMEDIVILPERFVMPPDFDPHVYLSRAFRMFRGEVCRVVVRFDPYQAQWIRERIWHPTQKITELEDGGLLFEVEGNQEEIKRWVMGYGTHAEIIEPPSLREEVKEEIKKLYIQYFESDR